MITTDLSCDLGVTKNSSGGGGSTRSITNEYLAGMQSAADLVRYGVHLTDGIKL